MIEKIPDQIPVQTGEWRGTTFDIIPKEEFAMACRKINELVDAVNRQQIDINNHGCRLLDLQNQINELKDKGVVVEPAENVRDKFAEQRRWIGKVCWFWESDDSEPFADLLSSIDDTDNKLPYYSKNSGYWCEKCEPVKPTDSIIYKEE